MPRVSLDRRNKLGGATGGHESESHSVRWHLAKPIVAYRVPNRWDERRSASTPLAGVIDHVRRRARAREKQQRVWREEPPMKAATAGAATAVDVAFGILTRAQKLTPQQRFVANDATPAASRRFERAWHRLLHTYLERTPSAVHAAVHLDALGGRVHNDHIALRSFVDSSGNSGLAFLHRVFAAFGFAAEDAIVIPGLPVNARWYEPPSCTQWPKVFISELRTAELRPEARAIVYAHVDGFYGDGPHARGGSALRAALLGAGGSDQGMIGRMGGGGSDGADAAGGGGGADGAAGDDEAAAAALARLLDDPPWRPSAAEVGAVRAADGGDPAQRAATEYAAWTLTHGLDDSLMAR